MAGPAQQGPQASPFRQFLFVLLIMLAAVVKGGSFMAVFTHSDFKFS